MKTVYVNNQVVELNNAKEGENLNPSIVRRALRVLFGNTRQFATVRDSKTAYRATPSRIRKLNAADAYDAGCE